MAAFDNLNENQFVDVPSDSGSLLDADLPEMPGGDDRVQTIYGLRHAHDTAVAGVQAIRDQYPLATRLGNFADAATGAGHTAMRGIDHVAGAFDGKIDWPAPPDVEAMSHGIRSIYRPGV